MEKNTKYLIIGGIVIVLILLMGLAYMQGSQNNTATPTPTTAPSATPTATPTATPGSGTGSEVNSSATATPTATPASTPQASVTPTPTSTPQASVTPTPTTTPTPSTDPYAAPGWPYYNKQYGPSSSMGTIAVEIQTEEMLHLQVKMVMAETLVGVLPGSYGTGSGYKKMKGYPGVEVPLPTTWTPMGPDRYVSLGEFEYGSYTVYCVIDGFYYQWQTIVIDDSHKDWLVTFEDMSFD